MKTVYRALQMTAAASPATGLAAIKGVNLLFDGKSIFLILGLLGILSFGCFWAISSMTSDWVDANSQTGVLAFAENHRWITAIIGEFICGIVVVGLVLLMKGVMG